MNKAKTICEDYPNYTIYDERPFKIGYTTRDVNSRILELNDTNETNYKYWQFYYFKF